MCYGLACVCFLVYLGTLIKYRGKIDLGTVSHNQAKKGDSKNSSDLVAVMQSNETKSFAVGTALKVKTPTVDELIPNNQNILLEPVKSLRNSSVIT